MALIKINHIPSNRELRQFAAIWLPIFVLVVAGLLYRAATAPLAAIAVATFGLGVSAVGFARPSFIRPIYLMWMYAAYPIGFVVSHLVLGTVFYGVLTPVGLIMKLVGYDSLQRQLRRSEGSYWTRVEKATDNTQYFRQF